MHDTCGEVLHFSGQHGNPSATGEPRQKKLGNTGDIPFQIVELVNYRSHFPFRRYRSNGNMWEFCSSSTALRISLPRAMHLQAWPILDTLQTTKRRIPKSPVRQHSWWLQEVGSAWIRDFTTSTGWIIPGAAMATPKNRAGKIGRP